MSNWECIHEGQRQKKLSYMCGYMNQEGLSCTLLSTDPSTSELIYKTPTDKFTYDPGEATDLTVLPAFESRFTICKDIRESAAFISQRLHEAGVRKEADGRYMMSPIQAAVSLERPSIG